MLSESHRHTDHVGTDQRSIHEQLSNSISTARGLPENTVYRDTGCDLAPSCLECPLALCKYDDPGRTQRNRTLLRDTEIMRLFANGFKISAIAREVSISDRTVYRIIQRELGLALEKPGPRPKPARRRRALRDRVPIEQLDAWRQYPLHEMAGAIGMNHA